MLSEAPESARKTFLERESGRKIRFLFTELQAVADTGGTMPPKSTYIEPKLRSGLVVYSLEDV